MPGSDAPAGGGDQPIPLEHQTDRTARRPEGLRIAPLQLLPDLLRSPSAMRSSEPEDALDDGLRNRMRAVMRPPRPLVHAFPPRLPAEPQVSGLATNPIARTQLGHRPPLLLALP